MIAPLWTVVLGTATALAGSGPWTLPAGARNLYAGTTQTRFTEIKGSTSSSEIGIIQATTLQAIGTVGLIDGMEVELAVPWSRVNQLERSARVCQSDGRRSDFCASSASLAPLQFTLKGRLLDEGSLRPVTMSAAVSIRTGNTTAHYRDRLTATGDGQTDVGLTTSVGRTGTVGSSGWFRVAIEGSYWYRTPLASPPTSSGKVPADQVELSVGGLVAPTKHVGVGPIVTGFHRLDGIDLDDLNDLQPDDPNGFPALAASQVKAGGTLALCGENNITLSISALMAVWARNNPTDTRVLSVGLGWYQAMQAH